jgi:SAM-dependent methyltransferase
MVRCGASRPKHCWEVVRDYVLELRPRSILDVGCGECMLWRGYGYEGRHNGRDPRVEAWRLPFECQVVLLDLDVYKHPLPFVQGNALYLPFRDGAFDVVVATEVIEHTDDPEKFAREVRRVGRRLILTTPVEDDPALRRPLGEGKFLQNPWRINLIKAVPEEVYPHHSHLRILTESELEGLFPDAEIRVERNAEGVEFYVVVTG